MRVPLFTQVSFTQSIEALMKDTTFNGINQAYGSDVMDQMKQGLTNVIKDVELSYSN